MEKEKSKYQQLASDALFVQSACNLSGVINSLSRGMDILWEEAKKERKGTDWVNTHPICQLFATQIVFLTHGSSIGLDYTIWKKAVEFCERLSGDKL